MSLGLGGREVTPLPNSNPQKKNSRKMKKWDPGEEGREEGERGGGRREGGEGGEERGVEGGLTTPPNPISSLPL